ncbi:MAG: 30S ribosomal protein S16 [Candidatus Portnoybacteria bacterium]|nr:30S ribosomal protein S16 [Candidatus Portnoybacteria bacterium]
MLTIRLARRGKRNDPSFRLVVTEKSNPVKGKFLEELGFYNPRQKAKSLKKERIQYWLGQGVECSATIHNMFVSEGILKESKIKAWRPKKREGAEGAESAAPAAQVKVEEKAEEKAEEKKEGAEAEKPAEERKE